MLKLAALWLILLADTDSEVVMLRRCIVEYKQATALTSPQSSFMQDVMVRPGDKVHVGQVLGRLYNQDIKSQIELYTVEADTDVYVRIARADYDLAIRRWERSQFLTQSKAVSQEDLHKDRYAVQRAALAMEEAELRRKTAIANRRRAESELRVREFISPHAGVVVEVRKRDGESVSTNELIFRVINLDVLNMIGRVNLVDANALQVGQSVTILPGPGARNVNGKVAFIDPQIDPDTQTCKLVVEVDNRGGLLRGGMTVDATIYLQPEHK